MQGDGCSNQPDVVIILQNICISKHQLHMYNFYLSTLSQESWGEKIVTNGIPMKQSSIETFQEGIFK